MIISNNIVITNISMRELVIWVDFFRSEVLWGKIGERQTVASEKTSQFIFGNCEKKPHHVYGNCKKLDEFNVNFQTCKSCKSVYYY